MSDDARYEDMTSGLCKDESSSGFVSWNSSIPCVINWFAKIHFKIGISFILNLRIVLTCMDEQSYLRLEDWFNVSMMTWDGSLTQTEDRDLWHMTYDHWQRPKNTMTLSQDIWLTTMFICKVTQLLTSFAFIQWSESSRIMVLYFKTNFVAN